MKMSLIKDQIIDSRGKDGKNKPLKFDNDGNLIIQYTDHEHDNQAENESLPISRRYRYYEDLSGNQYRYTTHRQEDGKFHASIHRYYSGKRFYKKTKERAFTKKKLAIAWCVKAYSKARERQEQVRNARAIRKKQRDDLKPKGKTKSKLIAQNKIKHYKGLQKKIDRKIKSLTTRRKNYDKKIKYYQKRELLLGIEEKLNE